ncbi:hypothetical protein GDO86_000026, partial [Hymenochirus boettgeri]
HPPFELRYGLLDLPIGALGAVSTKRFRSLSSLRAHLEYNHTYETLYVLSKTIPLIPRFTKKVEIPFGEIFTKTAMASHIPTPAAVVAAAAASAVVDAAYEEGLARLKVRAFEKLKEVVEIDLFLKETASREANAKVRLQQFIEELLDRADRAEKQLQIISSCGSTPNGSLSRGSMPGYKVQSRQIDRHPAPVPAAQGSFSVSNNQRSASSIGASGRVKTVSQSSGGYDSDGAEHAGDDERLEGNRYAGNNHEGDSSFERSNSRGSGLRRQAIQNWQRRPYRNSTEGEEGDISDVGSRTTESEAEVWEQESVGSAELNSNRASGGCRPKGCCEGRIQRPEKGSPSRSNEVISPEILKMRAALFCIFTYLDTKTLLRVAEVSRDWKFVARHPAVWTRVFLENTRVSPKFLVTLSQWCTQTHSLTLQNLKPRQRGKKETKEEYTKSTRGCLEAGLESLLKATGGNLLILRISQCPNVLTDRSLWLASCYCRALQAVTYRSSTDPVGHEVIWALGAGCRDIISLQVAPLHPCQQPTRFSNRCLQMIGRCWPHLRALGVGGAGCGVQGLSSLARNCMRLQVLELDHVTEINQEVAAEVCREGLKGLEMLVLTSTPVTPKALLHFNSVCRNLKSIVVQVGIADYFKDPTSPEARKLFEEMVNKLQVMSHWFPVLS